MWPRRGQQPDATHSGSHTSTTPGLVQLSQTEHEPGPDVSSRTANVEPPVATAAAVHSRSAPAGSRRPAQQQSLLRCQRRSAQRQQGTSVSGAGGGGEDDLVADPTDTRLDTRRGR
jgi:hypothetical protein